MKLFTSSGMNWMKSVTNTRRLKPCVVPPRGCCCFFFFSRFARSRERGIESEFFACSRRGGGKISHGSDGAGVNKSWRRRRGGGAGGGGGKWVGSKLPREEEEEESWIRGLGFDGTPTQIVWRRDRAIMALRSSDAASEPDNVTFLHTPTHTLSLSLSLSRVSLRLASLQSLLWQVH